MACEYTSQSSFVWDESDQTKRLCPLYWKIRCNVEGGGKFFDDKSWSRPSGPEATRSSLDIATRPVDRKNR